MGAPAGQARPPGVPRRIAGDHRSPLHRRPKLRIVRVRAGPKAHSLRWASSPHRTRCAAVGGFAALRMRRAPCGYFAGLRRGPQLPQAPANGAGGDAGPVLSSQSQPTAAMGPGSRVEGAGGAFDENPREATSKNAGPGGFPTAFDSKSGAPAAQARPPGVPRRIAGDHRSPLHRRPKLRIIRFRVNAKAHSLRWASSPHDDHSVGSPRGAPLGAPSRTPGHLLLPRWGNSPCRAPRSQQLQGKTGG